MARRKLKIRIGIITDIHFGFDTGGKLGSKAARLMQAFGRAVTRLKPAFIVDMGDRISARNSEGDRHYMESLMEHFNRMATPVRHITGNHDVHHLSREENRRITGCTAESFSQDYEGYHFVFWNPHITKEGIGLRAREEDLEWLRHILSQHKKPTIVFSHAPLYHEENLQPEPNGKISARFHYAESERIRKILEESGQVRLCMNGHIHRNHHEEISGIHYIAQQSLTQVYQKKYRVPAAAWSWLEIDDDNIIVKLQGKVRKNYVVPVVA